MIFKNQFLSFPNFVGFINVKVSYSNAQSAVYFNHTPHWIYILVKNAFTRISIQQKFKVIFHKFISIFLNFPNVFIILYILLKCFSHKILEHIPDIVGLNALKHFWYKNRSYMDLCWIFGISNLTTKYCQVVDEIVLR